MVSERRPGQGLRRPGLAQGAGVPLWSTDSLRSRAAALAESELPVLSWLDARKGRAYAAWYASDGALVHGPADLSPEAALAWGEGAPFLAVGEGALVWAGAVRRAGGHVAEGADHPATGTLALLGAEGLARGEGVDPATVSPLYLREPDARPPRID